MSKFADFIRICLLDREAIKRVSNDSFASNIAILLIFFDLIINALIILITPISIGKIKLSVVSLSLFYLLTIVVGFVLVHYI